MNILLIVIFILLLIVCFFCYQCYQLLSAMQKTKVIEKSQIQSVPSTAEQGNENPIKAPERFSIKTFLNSAKQSLSFTTIWKLRSQNFIPLFPMCLWLIFFLTVNRMGKPILITCISFWDIMLISWYLMNYIIRLWQSN